MAEPIYIFFSFKYCIVIGFNNKGITCLMVAFKEFEKLVNGKLKFTNCVLYPVIPLFKTNLKCSSLVKIY